MSKIKSFDDMAAFIIGENNKLSQKMDVIKSELTEQMQCITEQFNLKLEVLAKENVVLQTRINELEDKSSRRDRNNQLIIRGVPVLEKENLSAIVKQIAETISFNMKECNGFCTYRLLSKKIPEKRMLRSESKFVNYPIVVVEFLAHWDKSSFLSKYLKFIKVGQLTHAVLGMGLTNECRVYVGENLTKANLEIFIKCASLKTNGKIVQYFTRNGTVFVRYTGSTNPMAISSVDLLINGLPKS